MDVKKIFEATTEEKMFENYIFTFEMLFNWRYPACSAKAGKRIDQSCCVLDMTGFSSSMMTTQVKNILKQASTISGDNYPENMGVMYCVNAPFIFSAAWAVVKGFLDERTVAKIKIIGGSY